MNQLSALLLSLVELKKEQYKSPGQLGWESKHWPTTSTGKLRTAGAGGSRLGLHRAQLVEALAQPLPQTESNFAQPQ